MPYADVVTFTTHKVLRGPRGGMILCKEELGAAIDKAVFPMMQGGPLMHVIAAKAVNLAECATPEYQAYAKQVILNAQALAKSLEAEGMRAITGGTDTHLSLHDLQGIGVSGKDAEARAGAAKIVLNKNAIPFDPAPPSVASGIRVGAPSTTTQGMGTAQMEQRWMDEHLQLTSGQSMTFTRGDFVVSQVFSGLEGSGGAVVIDIGQIAVLRHFQRSQNRQIDVPPANHGE